jgi:hypothetical protein
MEDKIKIDLKETGYAFLTINLASVMAEGRYVLNTVMNLWFLYQKGKFLVAERLSASQERFPCLELLLM